MGHVFSCRTLIEEGLGKGLKCFRVKVGLGVNNWFFGGFFNELNSSEFVPKFFGTIYFLSSALNFFFLPGHLPETLRLALEQKLVASRKVLFRNCHLAE